MKKLCPFLVLFIGMFTANSQIVNIPDANFKAKLLAAAPNNNTASTENPFITAYTSTVFSYHKIDTNNDGEIQVSEAAAIKYLRVLSSSILDLTGIEAFVNLRYLNVGYNNLSTINLTNLNLIADLDCINNQLSSLNTSNLTNLKVLRASNNQITQLDLSLNPQLQYAQVQQNLITAVNLSNNPALVELSVDQNFIETLDMSHTQINYLYAGNNVNLVSLNLKNNSSASWIGLSGNNSLQYICADEFEIESVAVFLIPANLSNVNINSYCSFVPGGIFYTIQGTTRYDLTNNGCDASDIIVPNQKFNFTSGSLNGSLFANNTGSYSYPVQQGNHIITPISDNPTYFNITPTSSSVTFPASASPFVQDFCLTANGTHNDLEVTLLPIGPARPGFDSQYKIIYKNKGTHAQSGSISMYYDDNILQLVSANPATSSQGADLLNWNFTNLLPFESREITIILNLNSPLETPPVNAGNWLVFSATVVGASDETPNDNGSVLTQTVVNSFDPNDKTCIQGTLLPINFVGEYVHYLIRFENTGTFAAENVVVKDIIDTTKFEMTTFVPLSGSHPFVTRVTNTNQVEFIFENINLPFDDANNDGYLAFKIKTKPTLVAGDIFSNSANIYFDYNAPIVTDTYTTTLYNPLNTNEFDFNSLFSLSPVPTKDLLTITAKETVEMSSVSIYNTIGQLVQVNTNPSETIDVSGLQSGSYFIKIFSDKGNATGKFIKE